MLCWSGTTPPSRCATCPVSPVGAAEHAAAARGGPGTKPWESLVSDLLQFVLTRLGLSPDQCGALVALIAGSRHYRHNGKRDSLLAAVRSATEHGVEVELLPAHRRRLAVYAETDTTAPGRPPHPCGAPSLRREPAIALPRRRSPVPERGSRVAGPRTADQARSDVRTKYADRSSVLSGVRHPEGSA